MRHRKKFNFKAFKINSYNRRSKFNNNPLLTWGLLIGLFYISYCLRYQANQWKAPTVKSNDTGMSLSQLYSVQPNIQNCQEGILNNSEAEKVLMRLNYIRSLHSLNPIRYNYNNDTYVAKAALTIAANAEKYEQPNSTFRCWSDFGHNGSKNSLSYRINYPPGNNQIPASMNLYKSEKFVDALLMDSRRENLLASSFLLNPFLQSISFRRVDGNSLTDKAVIAGWDGQQLETQADYISGATIKFTDNETQNISTLNTASIAYPIGAYPQELFKKDTYVRGYPSMLFSVISHQQKLVNKNVDFSNTEIEITGEDGKDLEVHSIQYKNDNTPLSNVITWKANQILPGVKYTVKIKKVKVFDTTNDYEYWFKLK